MCSLQARVLSCGYKYGTNSMNRHMKDCKKIKFENLGQMMIDGQARLKSNVINQMISREMCASAIIGHDLPFNFVEYKNIRAWVKYLNPNCLPISRNTTKADVIRIYMREKEKLKTTLTNIPSRICLTSDMWTTCTTEGNVYNDIGIFEGVEN
ncbi:hypothetical protein TanjilG_08887 [Lupinus angustifolius]|uniref:hAT-like transposase RNase-H fold domain-containing protein n=1 Tax=Lupinus angustifolius TaxID=3871 RepID=A0A1J7G6G0_LUPAN|nr:hypothetical protein TanjilG_08887 [Lupinus angustifolius]